MYLVDTNVISEARKGPAAHPGVTHFFRVAASTPVFISVITVGEIRRGIELLKHRGDKRQAARLELWLTRRACNRTRRSSQVAARWRAHVEDGVQGSAQGQNEYRRIENR